MFSVLASRVVLRTSALNSVRITRFPVPVFQTISSRLQSPTWTRTFLTASSVRLAQAAEEPTAAKKTTTKRATIGRTKTSKKKVAKKPAKKVAKTAAQKPGRGVDPAKQKQKALLEKKRQARQVYAENRPPKRHVSSYGVFWSHYVKDHPLKGTPSEDLISTMRAGAAEWKALSDAEKQRYADEARVINQERRQKFLEYESSLDVATLRTVNAVRKAHGKHKIHRKGETDIRSLTSFSRYFKQHRAEVEIPADMPNKERIPYRMKALGQRWKAMSDVERQPYVTASAEGRAQLAAEKERTT
ncbi:hypothetical protein BKA93DRAFT_830660 [Sparassis latifolia]|uniref:HMG box domain-containing protein n=1 Tax=Sparassis crispa TaxID=139825 RepID=A0A401GPQ5_9APHY|nr:predicted protein [Sparassis crispa]GBE84203.1 predicted protein [Sparassis crispa]